MLDFRVTSFLTVCHTMNFTKAAAELNLTQPAVTQQIHYLENYYGVKLFCYEKKVLTLTEQGSILYARLNAMEKDEEIIRNELRKQPDVHPLISIGVTMTIGEYAVISPLTSYIRAHPAVNIHVHYGNTQELLRLLDQGKISLALIEGYYPEERYGHRKYRTEEYICVCAKNHVFQNGTPRQIRDLLPERLLVRESGSGTRNILERYLAAQGMTVSDFPSFMEIENMHTLIQLLLEDCGISFLYRIAANEGLAVGQLREIRLTDFFMRHDFDFIWDKNSIFAGETEKLAEELAL